MKIARVTAYPAREWRTFLFVVVETDEGIRGIGEAGITGRELAVAGVVEHLRPLLIGEDPFRTEHLWQLMFRGGFYPAGELLTAAIAAIDVALWDIKGKALGVPVYDLLGGRVRDRVDTYTHIHGDDTDEVVQRCVEAVAAGWRYLRWELHHAPDLTLEPRVAVREAIAQWTAVREALGDDIELIYDVHTRLDPPDAVRLCRALEPYRPFFIEDPLRSENPDSYVRLRAQTAVPLAAGEQYGSKWDFRQLIEDELIDYARVDVAIAGGFTEARKIAAWCETHHIDLAVHNPIGPVATSASLHLDLATSNMAVQELPRLPRQSLPDVVLGQPEWRDGALLPPSAPGLGIELDTEALEQYPYSSEELPRLRREDGSFTNW